MSHAGLIDRRKEVNLANQFRADLRIKTPNVHVAAGNLSGGNQQKVALARWLATRPKVMILDEPTQGVDVGSKSEIHELIVSLAEQGMAVILISSELPEVLGMSDRIAVFHSGTIAGFLSREAATQESIMELAFGHISRRSHEGPHARNRDCRDQRPAADAAGRDDARLLHARQPVGPVSREYAGDADRAWHDD